MASRMFVSSLPEDPSSLLQPLFLCGPSGTQNITLKQELLGKAQLPIDLSDQYITHLICWLFAVVSILSESEEFVR